MTRPGMIALLAGSLVSGSVAADFTALDHRIAIEVTQKERNQILYEMREFLHGWHNIHHALARNDMKAVALETPPCFFPEQQQPCFAES